MAREIANDPEQFGAAAPAMERFEHTAMSPERAATLGGIMDAVSTYAFLKRGTAREANALWKPLGNRPLATAAAVLGGVLAMKGARHLLRKAGKPRLADVLAGGMGSYQFGLGAQNLESDLNRTSGGSSDARLMGKLHAALRAK